MLSDTGEIVVVIISIAVSVILHEVMHGLMAYRLGDDTAYLSGRLTLNPLKHIDPFGTVLMPLILFISTGVPLGAAKPVPFNPARLKYDEFGAALVGIAGPLTNLVLAVVSGLWLRFVVGLDSQATIATDAVLIFMLVNLSFFVFNMIPFPPLDGSRVLYAFAPEPLQKLMRQIEQGGIFIFLIFFFTIFQNFAPVIGELINDIASIILGVPNVFGF